jgi:SAM-dependent methyltransferase
LAETYSNPSQAGEAWKKTYEDGLLTWCSPENTHASELERFSRSEWIQRILVMTGLKPGPHLRVLDAGCGTAIYSLSLALLGCRVEAFDYNPQAVEIARSLEASARQAWPGMEIRISQGNLLDIGFPEGSFDLVFNQGVLEYFCDPVERQVAYRELVRVARPGGRVGLILQHTGHPFGKTWRRLGWEGYTRQPTVRAITPHVLQSELEQAGLQQVRVDGIEPWHAFFFYPPWYRRWKWSHQLVYLSGKFLDRYVPLPLKWRASLGRQILGVGLKP